MAINTFFYEHPIFSYEEFAAWKAEQGTITPHAIHTALQYHLKVGTILRLRRQLYAVVPPNETAETMTVDPYLLAAKISKDSILAYHSALELHGFAYTSFEQFTVITEHKIKPFEFRYQWFKPVTLPTVLAKQATFGIETLNRQGIEIKITTVARTFVDVLDRIELCGGWEEVCRSINNIAVLDVDAAISYCLKFKNARLAAKVGYFLDQRQGAFKIPEAQLKLLLNAKPISPQYLSKKAQKKCRLVKKWNIMIPENVINQQWEELDAAV